VTPQTLGVIHRGRQGGLPKRYEVPHRPLFRVLDGDRVTGVYPREDGRRLLHASSDAAARRLPMAEAQQVGDCGRVALAFGLTLGGREQGVAPSPRQALCLEEHPQPRGVFVGLHECGERLSVEVGECPAPDELGVCLAQLHGCASFVVRVVGSWLEGAGDVDWPPGQRVQVAVRVAGGVLVRGRAHPGVRGADVASLLAPRAVEACTAGGLVQAETDPAVGRASTLGVALRDVGEQERVADGQRSFRLQHVERLVVKRPDAEEGELHVTLLRCAPWREGGRAGEVEGQPDSAWDGGQRQSGGREAQPGGLHLAPEVGAGILRFIAGE